MTSVRIIGGINLEIIPEWSAHDGITFVYSCSNIKFQVTIRTPPTYQMSKHGPTGMKPLIIKLNKTLTSQWEYISVLVKSRV